MLVRTMTNDAHVPTSFHMHAGSIGRYSPETRAAIGKYTSRHGTLAASTHFCKKLSMKISKSTVQSLKNALC